ncbi:MAG: hypothetical protein WCD77_17520 [Acidobacteriaceae bacterium]
MLVQQTGGGAGMGAVVLRIDGALAVIRDAFAFHKRIPRSVPSLR